MQQNNRKKRLVHRDIQLTLVKRLLFQWVVFLLATGLVTVIVQYLVDPLQSYEVFSTRVKATVGAMFLVAICLAPLFVRDSIKLSLRFVGPVVRLRSAIQMVEPNVENPRIRLRKSDYWQELASDFNAMLDRIESERQTVAEEPMENAIS